MSKLNVAALQRIRANPKAVSAIIQVAIAVVALGVGVACTKQFLLPVWAAATIGVMLYMSMQIADLAIKRGRMITKLETDVARLRDNIARLTKPVAETLAGKKVPISESDPANDLDDAAAMAGLAGDGDGTPALDTSPVASALEVLRERDLAAQRAREAKGSDAAERRRIAATQRSAAMEPRRMKTAVLPAKPPVRAIAAPAKSKEKLMLMAPGQEAPVPAAPRPEPQQERAAAQPQPIVSERVAAGEQSPIAAEQPSEERAQLRRKPVKAEPELPTVMAMPDFSKKPADPIVPVEPTLVAEPEPEPETLFEVSALHPDAPSPVAPEVDDAALAESLRALRAVADSMRPGAEARTEHDDPVEAIEPAPELSPQPYAATGMEPTAEAMLAENDAEPMGMAIDARLSALAEALAEERIDVLFEPILTLADQTPRHYEISIRLRSEAGEPLHLDEAPDELRGTGILPLIDLSKLTRVAELSRRLADRGKTGAVFTGFASESLSDDDFLARFAEICQSRGDFPSQLVIGLAQAEVRTFARAQWAMVADMRDLGFRFALEDVTDLDMDLGSLSASGVQFVKLDASVFLEGLPAPGGVVIPSADICRHLAALDLKVIVERIDNDADLHSVTGFGVEYGQGQMFGGARPVKAEVFAREPKEAAA